MEIFSSFKKDYFNYLFSIIIPSVISGISIPIYKHILGPEGYGHFSLWLNGVLIAVAIFSAWIAQTIIRFFSSSSDKKKFHEKSLSLSVKTQAIFFLPSLFVVYLISHDIKLSILCAMLLLVISIHFSILALAQASFLSKKIIWAELIRVLIYFGLSLCLLLFTQIHYLYSLLFSSVLGYFLSMSFLLLHLRKFHAETEHPIGNMDFDLKVFFRFGLPFSLWFILSYLLTYIDKIYALHIFGANTQGNYQALFDLLNKSIVIIISPVVTSLYPILTQAFSNHKNEEIKYLLKKIIFFELIGFTLVSVFYWWFGANIVLKILSIPVIDTYKWMGYITIAGTFVWQLAIVVQKKYELKMKPLFLVLMLLISLSLEIALYQLPFIHNNAWALPLGFLLAAVIYLSLISIGQIKKMVTHVAVSKTISNANND